MSHCLTHVGANPGRSGHRLSISASRIIYSAREAIAELFNAPDPLKIIFSSNATDALNQALYGLLSPGDHVITSSMEHNSMMRPLRNLELSGVEVTVIPCGEEGLLSLKDVESAIQPNTRFIAINHASNVCGTVQALRPIGELARKHNLLFLVDAAQSAGNYHIDLNSDFIDIIVFTGHKSLYGPQGTGGLVLGSRINEGDIKPFRQGGTGSHSEHEVQPTFFPDALESGTPNTVGIAGLDAGVRWILKEGISTIREKENQMVQLLESELRNIIGVTVHGREPNSLTERAPVLSFSIKGESPSEIGLRLDEDFEIMCRVGLHCAPTAHRTLGTFPEGTVRFSLGYFNTEQEIFSAVAAIRKIASQ